MENAKSLRKELTAYDGRSPTILSEISVRYQDQKRYLSNLIVLAFDEEPNISEGSTWMLKAALEEGRTLSSHKVKQFTSGLYNVTAWQAQLHVCQSIQYLAVPQESKLHLEPWLKALLDAPRPLLRAWSLDALCRVYGGSSPKAKALLDKMEKDDAASVVARIRNLRREFEIK